MSDRLILVSADGHAGGPPEVYRDYIDSRFLPDLEALAAENDEWTRLTITCKGSPPETLDVIDERGCIRSDGELGAWDLERRIRELDGEGVACELLLSGHQMSTLPFFGVVNNPYSPELRMAGTRAYHRWLADGIAASNGRLAGVAETGPCVDIDDTVQELRWVADHGFVGVMVPGMVADPALPPLYSDYYEPFWAACADLGLVLTMHAGWGGVQGQFQQFLAFMKESMGGSTELDADLQGRLREMLNESADSPLRLEIGPRRALWQLMAGGVFDRHPALRLVLTEVRADWVPATLAHLDRRFAQSAVPLTRLPSEYYRDHCAVAPSSPHRAEIEMRAEIGVERFLFGMDFPHPEGTWPNTWDWIRAAFAGVPEAEARAILGENAIELYRLDRDRLAAVAAEIGPRTEDVLGTHEVDARKVEHFHKRSGFSRPAEDVDLNMLDAVLNEDLAALATAGQ